MRVEFTGSGREYFRLWASSLALTLLTLGLYSPWAKARRLRYFCRHTHLGGASFDYHGKPLTIFKRRLRLAAVALAFGALWQLLPERHEVVILALLCLAPWALLRAIRHRLANTSYGGVRFRFHGLAWALLWPMVFGPLVTFCWFFFFYPNWAVQVSKYLCDETSYGGERFVFDADTSALQWTLMGAEAGAGALYACGALLKAHVAPSAFGGDSASPDPLFGALLVLSALGLAAALVAGVALVRARVRRLVWSGLRLGPHRFSCDLRGGAAARLALKNATLCLLTLGLYAPFAAVASAKQRLESVSLLPGAPTPGGGGALRRDAVSWGPARSSEHLEPPVAPARRN